jgi:hypothetical protein
MRLGAYYWDGWYAKIPHWTDRLMNEFQDREPTWGWLGDTVENMELQIDIAADAGLSYFAYDWYYPEDGKIRKMNDAVDRFLKAKNRARMNFCLLVANHQGGLIYRQNWEHACELFLPYLKNEHAMKTKDGKPVLIFFSIGQLKDCLGGEEETRMCLEYLRSEAKKVGLPGVCVLGCAGPPRDEIGDVIADGETWVNSCKAVEALGLDGITGYNYHRSAIKVDGKVEYIYPYESLARDHEIAWNGFAKHSKIPYMPLVIGGWDCRPWETVWEGSTTPHARSCYSPDITPPQLYRHVKNAGEWSKSNQEHALEDFAIVYAWNENGEGGYIEPTNGDNGRKLAAVKQALEELK